VGPFFHDALCWPGGATLVLPEARGERIEIIGRVFDADREPVPDALVEIWQADADGRYAHPADEGDAPPDPAFRGFGRCGTGPSGDFRFLTVRPGRVAGPAGTLQAPHVAVGVLARGLLKRLVTRLYFEDSPENAGDPVLALVEDPARRATLVARRVGGTPAVYRFDIVLSGDGETVFFDC
jgi:protocatechuate 3,4-dioxygenase alpha subunit